MGFFEVIFANLILFIFGVGGVSFTIILDQINYLILLGSIGFILLAVVDSFNLYLKRQTTIKNVKF